jgi:hypothetical protein
MKQSKTELIAQYLHKVKEANKELTKKEAFKDLLNRLYAGDNTLLRLIDKITLGAESTIINIPRKDKLHKGSADTLYNNIIIEFENNLGKTLDHAKEQLSGYLLGKLRSGEGYNFTLIASDFINWQVFAPDVEQLDIIATLNEDELKLNEIKSTSFTLNENNTEDFYYWIDRFLFKEDQQHATLKRIEEAFGYQSSVFIESFRELSNWFNEAKKYGEVQVSFEQWAKFLSVAYGSFEGSDKVFLIHTYLSIFSKMLAYSVISNDDYIDDNEMREILDGSIFYRYNIKNFVDNDFFHWVVADRNFKKLKNVFRLIAQEIAIFDFNNVEEDILKGVYQELIDIDTRHSLGEYYTPDWLCERIVCEYNFNGTDKILDPACGSGSFLRAIIHRIKECNPKRNVYEINDQVYGIDIHPLSVQISKTTLLLTYGKSIVKSKKPIYLNIILANTLLAPEGVENLFGNTFQMHIDKEKYSLTTQIFDDVTVFDEALEICENLSEETCGQKQITNDNFSNIFKKKFSTKGLNAQIIESFYQVYRGLKSVKENGRDSIWKFIVQNLYKPYFLRNKFDYIIGNPPWFTYSSIRNEDYQNILNSLAVNYAVKPEKRANYPHLEIAAIFLFHCSNYYLKESGILAFVLPRSFLSADHHDNTRSGIARGFRLTSIWDLADVSPVFRIPSCVFFGHNAKLKYGLYATDFPGIVFSGKLHDHNCNLKSANNLIQTNVTWYYIKQGNNSAYSTTNKKSTSKINPYKHLFKQGATIVPRSFYFIELNQDYPEDFDDRIINVKTSVAIKTDAKPPWKEQELKGKIESKFLFRTALAKSILPFIMYKPDLVLLPILLDKNKKILLYEPEQLRNEGYFNIAQWFRNAENIWEIFRTEKNSNSSCIEYLNWQNKIRQQDLNAKYLVIYNMSGKDAYATLLIRDTLDFEFIVDYTTFRFETNNIDEGYYLTSIMNSCIPNLLMKDFQAKGLFGARHVSRKILDIYYPSFDSNNKVHIELAKLGKIAHKKASEYLINNPPQKELSPTILGRLRMEIKKYLALEMKEIDHLVKKIIK